MPPAVSEVKIRTRRSQTSGVTNGLDQTPETTRSESQLEYSGQDAEYRLRHHAHRHLFAHDPCDKLVENAVVQGRR